MKKIKITLYVIGESPISRRAIKNLKLLVDSEKNKTKFEVNIIDLIEHEGLAEKMKIIATPLLLKELPEPMRRIIGDLSDTDKVKTYIELL
ncbi:MAG: circadian clock KaiB family protein [Legionellaceae bacterium]|nr:circadian clock KaiB family protein [Legionellaceae bacterium]